MTTAQEVRDIAKLVRESANDLRMLELLGAFVYPRDLAGEGDSGADRYLEFSNTAGEAVKVAQSRQSAQLGTEFDWIIEYFERYARISEEPYVGMHGALQAVAEGYDQNAVSFVEKIQGRFDLNDWRGLFAQNLEDNLFAPLNDVPNNQARIARELQIAVLAHWNIVLGARTSIVHIGAETKKRLDAVSGVQTATPPSKATMPVVGAVLAILGTVLAVATRGKETKVLTLGLSMLGALKAITDAALAVHDAVVEGDAREAAFLIQGNSSAEIIASMNSEIAKLNEYIRTEEESLKGKLETSIGTVDSWLADTEGGDGTTAHAWHLQAYRSELADELPDCKEMNNAN